MKVVVVVVLGNGKVRGKFPVWGRGGHVYIGILEGGNEKSGRINLAESAR